MTAERKPKPTTIRFRVHPATKWTDEMLAGAIYDIWENGEPITTSYLAANHSRIRNAASNRPGGLKRIYGLAGIEIETHE